MCSKLSYEFLRNKWLNCKNFVNITPCNAKFFAPKIKKRNENKKTPAENHARSFFKDFIFSSGKTSPLVLVHNLVNLSNEFIEGILEGLSHIIPLRLR